MTHADQRAEHARDARSRAAALSKSTTSAGQDEREADVGDESDRQRLQQRGGVRDGGDEQDTRERKPGHRRTPV